MDAPEAPEQPSSPACGSSWGAARSCCAAIAPRQRGESQVREPPPRAKKGGRPRRVARPGARRPTPSTLPAAARWRSSPTTSRAPPPALGPDADRRRWRGSSPTRSRPARSGWSSRPSRRAQAGDEAARARPLRELHQASPGDVVVAVFLSELERRAGEPDSAQQSAATLAASAREGDDADLGAALRLEAALLLWRSGDRARAVEELEAAIGHAPKAASTLLGWALRGASPDTIEGRRRALEVAADAGADPTLVALERFGLEAVAGEPR